MCFKAIGFIADVWMLWKTVYHDGLKEIRDDLSLFKPKYYTVGCRVNEKIYLEFMMMVRFTV